MLSAVLFKILKIKHSLKMCMYLQNAMRYVLQSRIYHDVQTVRPDHQRDRNILGLKLQRYI